MIIYQLITITGMLYNALFNSMETKVRFGNAIG